MAALSNTMLASPTIVVSSRQIPAAPVEPKQRAVYQFIEPNRRERRKQASIARGTARAAKRLSGKLRG